MFQLALLSKEKKFILQNHLLILSHIHITLVIILSSCVMLDDVFSLQRLF